MRSCSRSTEHAKARGAHIYAEVLGAGSTAGAPHHRRPPGGIGALNCMEIALEDAGLEASQVAHINGRRHLDTAQ